MEFERGYESQEVASLAQRRERIVELYKRGWNGGRRFPFMPEAVDETGRSMEKTMNAPPGRTAVENVDGEDGIIRNIRTGTGYIAIGSTEMMTKELTGCMGVIVLGKTKDGQPLSALFHMTPTTKLSWGNFRQEDDDSRWGHDTRGRIAGVIVEELAAAGADLETCQASLVRTAGFPPHGRYHGYDEKHLQEKTADLAAQFAARGLRTEALPSLLMESATVYWNPKAPDELLAVGEKRLANPNGGADEPEISDKSVATELLQKILR